MTVVFGTVRNEENSFTKKEGKELQTELSTMRLGNSHHSCVALSFLLFLFSSFAQVHAREPLLNAYKSSLDMLTAPNTFYFLEFPPGINDVANETLQPICGNGSPYSFAFRRGTQKHLSKLIVEFEGGPACWKGDSGGGCACNGGARETPWNDYLRTTEKETTQTGLFPKLGSCTGLSPGFIRAGGSYLISGNTDDVPLFLRGGDDNDNNNNTKKEWWELLSSDSSNIHDWSYILLPHCTLDWNLGYKRSPQPTGCGNERVNHRGGANVNAVLEWVTTQFPSGLDALVTTSGGKVGGCDGPVSASSVAPAIFAEALAAVAADTTPSSVLVITEGASLWNKELPVPSLMASRWNAKDLATGATFLSTMEHMVTNASNALQYAWMGNEYNVRTNEEVEWLAQLKLARPVTFHVHAPLITGQQPDCPLYAFPNDSPIKDLSLFFRQVTELMSWSSASAASLLSNDQGKRSGIRLSFLTILLILVAILALVWLVYFTLRDQRLRENRPLPPSPNDLWFAALTRYPRVFLVISLSIPILLSYLAYVRADYTISVNLDFDTYLDIATDQESVSENYALRRAYQKKSLQIEKDNCAMLTEEDGNSNGNRMTRKVLETQMEAFFKHEDASFSIHVDDEPGQHLTERELQKYQTYTSKGHLISLFYQNRNGGTIFTQEVLKNIRDFEQSILDFPGFKEDYCFTLETQCAQFDSLIPNFFPDGNFVNDIDSVLRGFLEDQTAIWKMDQYFGPKNLASNITRTFVYLRDLGGDQSSANPFLKRMYDDLLWKVDQQSPPLYPNMRYTWANIYLEGVEADDALRHDALWSVASLVFIGFIVFLKVRNVFVVFFSVLGLVLAFSSSYYWCSVHFGVQEITMLHIAGLFVMLGIGADDIFLMIDSFDHTKVSYATNEQDDDDNNTEGEYNDSDKVPLQRRYDDHDVIRERMILAYRTAGSMMLVSSMTTAICFFSNAFGVLVAIQEFGIYMGVVVLINFVNVMTILPSAILVNELHFKPFQKKLWNIICFRRKEKNDQEHREVGSKLEDTFAPLEAETGSAPPPVSNRAEEQSTLRLDQQVHQNQNDFLKHTSRMNHMDRWLVEKYSLFVCKWRLLIVISSVIMAATLGTLGVINFTTTDGTIIIFKTEYNLGRLQMINDAYFNSQLYRTVTQDDINSIVDGSGGSDGSNDSSDPDSVPQPSPPTIQPNNLPSRPPTTLSPTSSDTGGGGSPFRPTSVQPPPTIISTQWPTAPETVTSTQPAPEESCVPTCKNGGTCVQTECSCLGVWKGPSCEVPFDQPDEVLKRQESIVVSLIWGVKPVKKPSNLWVIENRSPPSTRYLATDDDSTSSFDLSEPHIQEWLLEVVKLARNETGLNVQSDRPTWIELLRDSAVEAGIGFPIPQDLFVGYLQLLKAQSRAFRRVASNKIGTNSPGLVGEFLFASVVLLAEVPYTGDSLSERTLKEWTSFLDSVNERLPPNVPPVAVQSETFLTAYRNQATIDSTVTTWFVANGLCLLIILFFTQNVLLSAMVMATLGLIFLCLGGLLFKVFYIPFGPVEALGVSIFIGLSANYSLHVVHAYHSSNLNKRKTKVQRALFITGSPILASAFSTIGGSAFLFACRTWVLVELGILICSITALALFFSMSFLLAWLAMLGPLPCEQDSDNKDNQLHQCDLKALLWTPCHKLYSSRNEQDEHPMDGSKASSDDSNPNETHSNDNSDWSQESSKFNTVDVADDLMIEVSKQRSWEEFR